MALFESVINVQNISVFCFSIYLKLLITVAKNYVWTCGLLVNQPVCTHFFVLFADLPIEQYQPSSLLSAQKNKTVISNGMKKRTDS